MSILNGEISAGVIGPENSIFGEALTELQLLVLDGCVDVCLSNNGKTLFAAGAGKVMAFHIGEGRAVKFSEATFPGNARQMVYNDGYLYITARENGLYIAKVDESIHFINHIDTLELATGICVSNKIMCVTNRHVGVEIWNVQNPKEPVFLSSFTAGEAQSVFLYEHYAIVGDWMSKKVHIVDISDLIHPREISSFGVDGYTDGVYAKDGICYVATGHHNAHFKNRTKYKNYPYVVPQMLTDGYGCGHGLELFDITHPEDPEYMSCLKFPPLFMVFPDTWRVVSDGDYAYCSDTYNGFFKVNVKDPYHPFFEGFYKTESSQTSSSALSIQKPGEPILGSAVAGGKIYIASYDSGVRVLSHNNLSICDNSGQLSHVIIPPPSVTKSFFHCKGQAHSTAMLGNLLIAACGDDGLYALDAKNGRILAHENGYVCDVAVHNGYLYACCGTDGIKAYRFVDDAFSLLACGTNHTMLRQVVPIKKNGLLAAQSGVLNISFFRHSDDKIEYLKTIPGGGMLYHRHLARECLGNYLVAMPLAHRENWIDTDTLETVKMGIPESACPIEEGIACLSDIGVIIKKRRLGIIKEKDSPYFCKVDQAMLCGVPFLSKVKDKTILTLVNRKTGLCEWIDISAQPVLLQTLKLPGNPEHVMYCCDTETFYISAGHYGIITFKLN